MCRAQSGRSLWFKVPRVLSHSCTRSHAHSRSHFFGSMNSLGVCFSNALLQNLNLDMSRVTVGYSSNFISNLRTLIFLLIL
ncbi:hypothetical protein AB205_0171500 [Aquarana catesbeiana]|uniref:Uncharacterized protein n=1 Tax=Aquarana catesbeiana TaxID=8400 RepID=A0A2G9RHV9_AQUCT|nr:hypothetical protein AB205_0171500 [Aquarana catesbeiana]